MAALLRDSPWCPVGGCGSGRGRAGREGGPSNGGNQGLARIGSISKLITAEKHLRDRRDFLTTRKFTLKI